MAPLEPICNSLYIFENSKGPSYALILVQALCFFRKNSKLVHYAARYNVIPLIWIPKTL